MKKLLTVMLCLLTTCMYAQKRLEPEGSEYRLKNSYEGYLNTFLGKDNAIYICAPSFSSEYCLSYDSKNSELVSTNPIEASVWYDYWYPKNYKSNRKVNNEIKIREARLTIPKSVWIAIQRMLRSAVSTSMFDVSDDVGIDGTSYYFYDSGNVASTWSPNKGSRCGQLVDVMDSCCHYVDIQSVDSIVALIPKMEEITRYFNSLYPDDYYELVSNCDVSETFDRYYIKSFKLSIMWKKEEPREGHDETTAQDDDGTNEEMKKECIEYKQIYGEDFKTLSKSISGISKYTILVKNVEKPILEFGEMITVNRKDAVPQTLKSLIQACDNVSRNKVYIFDDGSWQPCPETEE